MVIRFRPWENFDNLAARDCLSLVDSSLWPNLCGMGGSQMGEIRSELIRNVVLIGQAGSGKTSLTEAMLFEAGATTRKGRIEDGTTLSDFEAEEIAHHHSISLSVLSFEVGHFLFNVLDTPGISEYVGELISGLAGADLAVLVLSAVDPIGPDSLHAWKLAGDAGMPRVIFINKLDRERARFSDAFARAGELFGPKVIALEIPIGEESRLEGVADLIDETAITYETGHGERHGLPSGLDGIEHTQHDRLVEEIVIGDDALMDSYLEGSEPSPEQLHDLLFHEVARGDVLPVVCGSALRQIGVDLLIDLITGIVPVNRTALNQGDLVAQVIKTYSDPFVGRVSMVKIHQGTLRSDTVVEVARTNGEERLHGFSRRTGKETRPITTAYSADIVSIPKMVNVHTGDLLVAKGRKGSVDPLIFPPSTYTVVIEPPSPTDDEKVHASLSKLADEDPTLVVGRETRSHRILLSGQGETHISTAIERLARRYSLKVTTAEPEIPFLITITKPAKAEMSYIRQSGGHGQYAKCTIQINPLPRGTGFVFLDEIVGGAIPKNFIPAVEKGIVEAMEIGYSSYPVVDVQVHLTDGKHHSVDSSEMSFRTAGSMAFKAAFEDAGPILLEPISTVEVEAPERYQGEILSDLAARRGRIVGTDPVHDARYVAIRALVPDAELQRYAVQLKSITSGQGHFTAKHSHYEPSALPLL